MFSVAGRVEKYDGAQSIAITNSDTVEAIIKQSAS